MKRNRMLLPLTAATVICLSLSGCASLSPPSADSFLASGHLPGSPRHSHYESYPGSRMAARELARGMAPRVPFAWETAGYTAAGEELQTVVTGNGDFRSVIVGSVGGHDPDAVRLTEQLARYLHDNSLILGGIRTTVIRTLNPDGLWRHSYRNANGVYLNHRFPSDGPSVRADRQSPEEVRFLLRILRDERPHRVIHIRTVRDVRPMIAATGGAMISAGEVSDWFDADLQHLPEASVAGTMETYIAKRHACDMITVGIPRSTPKSDVWILYGDGVLSLLLDGDSESRRMARERNPRRWSADRRPHWTDVPLQPSPRRGFDLRSEFEMEDLPPFP